MCGYLEDFVFTWGLILLGTNVYHCGWDYCLFVFTFSRKCCVCIILAVCNSTLSVQECCTDFGQKPKISATVHEQSVWAKIDTEFRQLELQGEIPNNPDSISHCSPTLPDAIVGFFSTSYDVFEGDGKVEICVLLLLASNSTLFGDPGVLTTVLVPLIPVNGTAEGEDIGQWEEVASITHLPFLCSL